MAYSVDLRERVLQALERGMKRSEVITTFAVSEGSIKRWQKLRRDGKSLVAGRAGRKAQTPTPNDDAVVRRLVEATPDASLQEYADQWNELHEKLLSHWTIGRRIRRLNLRQKKGLRASERDRFERVLFAAVQAGFDADDVVVLDEFGSNIDLTRRYGRAPRGERVYEDLPRTRPRNTTTIASLTTQGIGPTLVISGSLNRTTFETYIEQVLGPSLRQGQVVILDNASAHHGGQVAQLIAERGCRVCYLPPYSPDFSPIELAFSKVKAHLRHLKARTQAPQEQALALALATSSAADARAFFAHYSRHTFYVT